jgi:hypothetical protein
MHLQNLAFYIRLGVKYVNGNFSSYNCGVDLQSYAKVENQQLGGRSNVSFGVFFCRKSTDLSIYWIHTYNSNLNAVLPFISSHSHSILCLTVLSFYLENARKGNATATSCYFGLALELNSSSMP